MSDTGASTTAGTYSNDTAASNRLQGPANSSTTSTGNYRQALTLVGGVVNAYGQWQAGKYNKKVADFNAEYARIQAEQALQVGNQQLANRELKERYIEGGTRSGFAGQGVVVGAGTSRSVLASEQAIRAQDDLMTQINARRTAYGYQVRAADETSRGKMAKLAGENGAISTLLDTEAQYDLESDSFYSGARSSRGTGG